jgi:hypothetical protein
MALKEGMRFSYLVRYSSNVRKIMLFCHQSKGFDFIQQKAT